MRMDKHGALHAHDTTASTLSARLVCELSRHKRVLDLLTESSKIKKSCNFHNLYFHLPITNTFPCVGSFAVAHNLAPDDNMIFYFDHQNRLV